MLTSLPLFQTLCYSFSSWTVYIDIINTNDERSSIMFILYVWWYIPTHIFLFPLVLMLLCSSSFFASSLSDHTDINTRLKSHRLSTVAHYHHVSLVNRHRVLSSLEMPHVHRLLSSVRYDSIYIVDTETSTPARLKISPLRRALSNPLQLTGTMEVWPTW